MKLGVGQGVSANELLLGVNVHMVLGAIEALAVLLGSARVFLRPAVLGGFVLPAFVCLAGFDGGVLSTRITLLGFRHDRRIDHQPAARDVAPGSQVLVEALNRQSPDDTASMMECANFRSSKQELR